MKTYKLKHIFLNRRFFCFSIYFLIKFFQKFLLFYISNYKFFKNYKNYFLKNKIFLFLLNYYFLFFLENFFKKSIFFKINFKEIDFLKFFLYNNKNIIKLSKKISFKNKYLFFQTINNFIFTLFFKNNVIFKNWIKKLFLKSMSFFLFFFNSFNNLFKNIFKKILKMFFCLGIYINISGKFLLKNGKKKKIKLQIGKIKFSSKVSKLEFSKIHFISLNGVFCINLLLSFI